LSTTCTNENAFEIISAAGRAVSGPDVELKDLLIAYSDDIDGHRVLATPTNTMDLLLQYRPEGIVTETTIQSESRMVADAQHLLAVVSAPVGDIVPIPDDDVRDTFQNPFELESLSYICSQ
jgi:hypothetical protein